MSISAVIDSLFEKAGNKLLYFITNKSTKIQNTKNTIKVEDQLTY